MVVTDGEAVCGNQNTGATTGSGGIHDADNAGGNSLDDLDSLSLALPEVFCRQRGKCVQEHQQANAATVHFYFPCDSVC